MDLKVEDVQKALAGMVVHWPEAGHNGGTISRLATDWFDLLTEEEVTAMQFEIAVRGVKKRCLYFPKLADVMNEVKRYRENPSTLPAPKRLMIADITTTPDNITPEEVKRNKGLIDVIMSVFRGERTTAEALEIVNKKIHIKEFGNAKRLQGKSN